MSGKQQQRQQAKLQVGNLSVTEKIYYSQMVSEKLFELMEIRCADTVLSYLASNNEVNLDEINGTMEKMGKIVAYPVCLNGEMEGYISKNARYVLNQYGIREPNRADAMMMNKEAFDVVIVPLLGFDEKCGRLGHGGGYYDKYLKDYQGYKVGVAFEAQKLDGIIMEENDVYLDCIVTETNIYHRRIGE